MSYMCETCLCNDRKLYALNASNQHIYHKLFYDCFTTTDCTDKVFCWECRAVLCRISKFVDRTKEAQLHLEGISQVNQRSLSSLGTRHCDGFDYEFTHSECQDTSVDYELTGDKIKCKLECLDEEEINVNNTEKHNEMDSKLTLFWVPPHDDETNIKTDNQFYYELPVQRTDAQRFNSESSQNDTKNYDSLSLNMQDFHNENDDDDGDSSSEDELDRIEKNKRKDNKNLSAEEKRSLYTVTELSEREMLDHRERDRNNKGYKNAQYKCETCIKEFKIDKCFELHMKTMHYEIPGGATCPICQCVLQNEEKLSDHKKTTHYSLYKCKECTFSNQNVKQMLSHCYRSHTYKTYQCNKCDKVFQTPSQRYRHQTAHKRYVCPLCGMDVNCLKTHMRTHSEGAFYECATCRKKYRCKHTYKRHLKTHLGESDPNAYCAECDKQFLSVSSYKAHLKYNKKHISLDSLRYECNDCDKKFCTRVNLQRHIDLVHLRKTKWRCEPCNKFFLSNSVLKAHEKTVHLKVLPERIHGCTFCTKKFATKQTLASHIRTHTGERPFHCSLCSWTFSHLAAWWTHNKLVHARQAKCHKMSTSNHHSNTDTNNMATL